MPQIPGIRNEADPDHWLRGKDPSNDVTGLYQSAGYDQYRPNDRDRRPVERVEHVGIETQNGERKGGSAADRQALVEDGGKPASGRREYRHRTAEDKLPSTRRHYIEHNNLAEGQRQGT